MIEFFDPVSRRRVALVTDGPDKDWLVYRLRDEWVTLRLADLNDKRRAFSTVPFTDLEVGHDTIPYPVLPRLPQAR